MLKDVHKYFLEARGYELDSYGHVNNAVYLNYFEQARWELFRKLDLLGSVNGSGLMLVVVDAHIRFQREVKIFDELEIITTLKKEDPYLVFHQKIVNRRNRLSIARGKIKTIFLDGNKLPQDIPAEIEKLLNDGNHGEA